MEIWLTFSKNERASLQKFNLLSLFGIILQRPPLVKSGADFLPPKEESFSKHAKTSKKTEAKPRNFVKNLSKNRDKISLLLFTIVL